MTTPSVTRGSLRTSEIRYRRLFEAARDGILILDATSRKIIDVNPFMIDLLGYSRDEFLGRELWELGFLKDEEASKLAFRELQETGYIRYGDLRLETDLGRKCEVEFISNVYDEGDRQVIQCNIRDITGRHDAEKVLVKLTTDLEIADDDYQRVLENSLDIICQIDEAGRFIHVSAAAKKVWGYEPQELVGKVYMELVHPDDQVKTIHAAANTLAGKPTSTFENRTIRKDGEIAYMMWSGNWSEAHQIMYCVARDVSETRIVEFALEDSDANYRNLIESLPAIVYLSEPHAPYRSIYVSPNVAAFGYAAEEWKGRRDMWISLLHDEDRDRVLRESQEAIDCGDETELEYRMVTKGGRVHWIREKGQLICDRDGNVSGWQRVLMDITRRKHEEQKLAKSEELYRDLVENAVDVIYTHDLKGNYTSVNKAAERVTGYTREEALAMNLESSVAPEYLEKARQMVVAKLSGKNITAYELDIIAKNGSRVTVEVNTRIIYENGVPVGVQGIARDITERKRAEREFKLVPTILRVGLLALAVLTAVQVIQQILDRSVGFAISTGFPVIFGTLAATAIAYYALQRQRVMHRRTLEEITERKRTEAALEESEASFKSLFETANDAILVLNEGVFRECNASAEKLFGCSRDEIIGKSPIAFSPPEQPDGHVSSKKAAAYVAAAISGEPQFFEWKHIQCDGTPFDAEVSLNLVDFGDKTHIQATVRDITERKHLAEQFRQSQKMESIGILAGGIAHDFNNLLTAILGYSDITLKRMPDDDPLRPNIREIRQAGDRAAALTGQLLAFSRKQVLKPIVLDLNLVISNLENMLRRIIRENIDLRTILAPDLGNISGDPGQIEQVIMNLTVNARDAMPGGGTLTIETKNVYLDENYVSQNIAVTPGHFVRMTVTDTGGGMDELTQSRIFEPFFTTKPIGMGTGLGLSTVYGVVKQSGGDIMVYSEVGHGTAFKSYLPCVDEAAYVPKWSDNDSEDLSGVETILVVEDEELVRNLVREILTTSGYKVLATANGPEALSICTTYSEPIHLLLTDVIMPKMSGPELMDQVLKLLPDIKVLFMSGYTDDTISSRIVLDSPNGFIEKPYTPDDLARKVRDVLDS